MSDILKDDFEKKLQFFVPQNWTKKDVLYYIKETRFSLDLEALNNNLRDPMRDFLLRGGKRIRPMLFLSCIELFGGNPKEYLDYAVAIELIHNGTLVLDDIEDKAELRRGQLSCHKKYGLDSATNVGISLHVLPLRILLDNDEHISLRQLERIIKIYADELTNVSFGQALDIYWHKHHPEDVSENEYLEMVRLKTGSLMRMSTRMACALMNRTMETEELFCSLGENLGMAFQVIDDCLDIDPPSIKFGKSFGNDITEGKLSLPVIYTLKKASVGDREVLIKILSKHTRDKRYISQAISIIQKYNSVDESRAFAEKLLLDSWSKLEKKWSKRNNLDNLRQLSLFLVKREY